MVYKGPHIFHTFLQFNTPVELLTTLNNNIPVPTLFNMMFSKAVVVSTMAIFAAASPWGPPTVTVTATAPGPTVTTISQCNTGEILSIAFFTS